MNTQGVPCLKLPQAFFARAERAGRRDSREEACIRAARLAPDGSRAVLRSGRGRLVSRPVPAGRPPEDIAAAAVPPAAAGRACEVRWPQASRSDALFKGGAREAPRSPQPMQYSGGARDGRGRGAAGAGGGSGRVGALPPRLRVPFAGVNWSRWRNGHPKAAVLGNTPEGGRRSEVAAPNKIRRPACGGRAGPLRTAPAHGCVSLTAKPARR